MDDALFSAAEARVYRPTSSLIANCDRCGLFRAGCKTDRMKPSGKGGKRILICSEYPGRDEDVAGEPFVGKTGQRLQAELSRVGIDMRRDCRLTNALLCYSPSAKDHKTAVADCRPNLLRTIAEFDPTVILLLGSAAVRSYITHLWSEPGAVGRWVGRAIPCRKPNAWVCVSYNTAHLLYGDDRVTELHFHRHLKQMAELTELGRPWPDGGPPDLNSEVEVVLSPEDAASRLRKYTGGTIAWDIETTTLRPESRNARIVCASVCWEGEETIAFPWHGPVLGEMKRILQSREVAKIGYSCQFETGWVREKLGIEIQSWCHDGMLVAHALDPRGGVTGLKYQGFTLLGAPDYNHHIAPFLESAKPGSHNPNRIGEVSLPLLCRYCGTDSLLEYRVAQLQLHALGIAPYPTGPGYPYAV